MEFQASFFMDKIEEISSGLEFYVRSLLLQYKPRLTSEELHHLLDKLIQMQFIAKPQFNIDKSKVRQGVLCQQCDFQVQMKFYHGQFICPRCSMKDDGKLLRQALNDYCLLIDEWITNDKFREFVGIASLYAARRLLKKLNLPFEGENRGRKYFIDIKRDADNL
ncbi:hypothetical protein [Bacillus ndiopicus]|uniref:hypothetical protein n=1 Tax=Bacillus ndiopicus TaxID=1347368 RepID=UPI0018A82FF2|nr:hypothetical protein [Bacillus ndiopicus]